MQAERSFFGRRLPGVGLIAAFADRSNASISLADDLISALESRALWSRYGL
jgi:serine protease SohB